MEFKNTKNMSLEEKKAYLEELKLERQRIASGEALRRQSGGFQAAAEAMMPHDPTGAFNLMDKRAQTDIKREQLLKNGGMNPEEVRRQLRMNADRDSQMALNPNLNPAEQNIYRMRANIYLTESEKDNPSLQQAAIDVGALIRGENDGATTKQTTTTTTTSGGTKAVVRSAIDALRNIKYKGKELDKALLDIRKKLNDASDLTQNEKEALYAEAEQAATKEVAPPTDVAKAKKFIEDAVTTLNPQKLYDGINSVINEIDGLKQQLKGDVGTASLSINMAPLKAAMGALSGSEYALAGTPVSALLNSIPFVGQTIANVSANQKFNNKDEAIKAINSMINAANNVILKYQPENMQSLIGYDGSPETFKAAVKQIGKLGPLKNIKPIALYNSKNTEGGLRTEKPAESGKGKQALLDAIKKGKK